MQDIPGAAVPRVKGRNALRLAVAFFTLALLILLLAPTLGAQTTGFEITIPITTEVFEDEGTETTLEVVSVPEEFVGSVCEVRAESQNQGSVHPGNDLIVKSGGSSITLEGVEDEPGKTVFASSLLTLGDTISVSLLMGPSERFSAGMTVIVDCDPQSTTSTTIAATSITAPPTTVEILPTSITAAPVTTVGPVATLPFTGGESGTPALLAMALIGAGLLVLVVSRRSEES